MSNRIERPVFFENQMLGAADLTSVVEHSRGQQARHNRYLHLWGIAQGLDLSGEDKQEGGETFKKITLSAGMAIDGAGREIVVPQSEQLSESKFDQLQLTAGVDLKQAWFPVFLVGQDRAAEQPAIAAGACGDSPPSRVVEGYEITFGRPGAARALDTQTAPNVADGPGKGGWKILLGFVQSNANGDKFIALENEVGGIGRRYAGVQADEVASRGGTLKLHTRINQPEKPALVLDEKDGGLLQFGLLTPQGTIAPVFTVDAQGNLTAEGKIKGALTTGGVQIESGIATDGMILPLPSGITEKQIADGEAIVHAHVSLRLEKNAAPAALATLADLAASPLETRVDADRRVHCLIRWFQIGGPAIQDHPGVCDYVVLASVKEKKA